MRIIGLCGRSGSGKGSFASVAKENGFFVIDCDAVYREMVSRYSECLKEIEANFGNGVIENNALNRKKLAPIVFADKEKLALLNSITHKHILAEVGHIISTLDDASYVVIDAPTLFESGANDICDTIVGVIADDATCIGRITSRDGINEEQALSRLSNQLTNDFIIENSDYIIYNETTYDEFLKASQAVVDQIKESVID